MQQREILFRGKHWQSGKWAFGAYLPMMQDENGSLRRDSILETSIHFSCDRQPIDPATLGQYTGLTDKNGVKIFEGDIAGCDSQGFGVVLWHQEKLMYCLKYKGIDGELLFLRELSPIDFIIGNIHDNPELINQ